MTEYAKPLTSNYSNFRKGNLYIILNRKIIDEIEYYELVNDKKIKGLYPAYDFELIQDILK